MKNIFIFVALSILSVCMYCFWFGLPPPVSNLLKVTKLSNYPMHPPAPNCSWVERSFLGREVTLYEQQCSNSWLVLSESSENTITGSSNRNAEYAFSIQLFSKAADTEPIKIVESWYENLTLDQKRNCEIRSIVSVPHKLRYSIGIRKEVESKITESYTELPGGAQYDYFCGPIVGAPLMSHPPYFEFDDRNAKKYLFVSSYGQDEPPIDWDSISF